MDLERCPKCGSDWQGGDICRKCRFVPIGAGLDKLPKKKKRKARRYVEPGSSRGLLLTLFLGLSAYGTYAYQPWKDDWELVRAMFGQGRHHSLDGEWEIVRTLVVGKASKPVLANLRVSKGALGFSKKGTVKWTLERGTAKTVGLGNFAVAGRDVAITGLKVSPALAGTLPSAVKLSLAWMGPDSLVATTGGGEAIYLRRRKKSNGLVRMMRMGVKPSEVEIPGQMRGVVATMQGNLDSAGE